MWYQSHGALNLGFKVLWSKNEGTDEVLEGTAKVHEGTDEVLEGTAQEYESTAHSLFKVLLSILKYCSLKNESTAEKIKVPLLFVKVPLLLSDILELEFHRCVFLSYLLAGGNLFVLYGDEDLQNLGI
ncbi:hypothetical protein Tco_0043091 [Tanacetum coccineum]